MQVEGNGFSKLTQVIRDTGYNKDIDIELATVTASPPNLKIKVDNMDVELEKDDLIVAERLTKYKQNIKLVTNDLNVNMSSEGYTPHTHDMSEIAINDAEIEFLDELKIGDRIIVASIKDGQLFVILDKAVVYNGA